jgi:hypothetical protein
MHKYYQIHGGGHRKYANWTSPKEPRRGDLARIYYHPGGYEITASKYRCILRLLGLQARYWSVLQMQNRDSRWHGTKAWWQWDLYSKALERCSTGTLRHQAQVSGGSFGGPVVPKIYELRIVDNRNHEPVIIHNLKGPLILIKFCGKSINSAQITIKVATRMCQTT